MDLLSITGTKTYAELYKKLKVIDTTLSSDKSPEAQAIRELKKSLGNQVDYKSDSAILMSNSYAVKNFVMTDSLVKSQGDKLTFLLLNNSMELKHAKHFDQHASTKEIFKSLIQEKNWNSLIITAPAQHYDRETRKTIEQLSEATAHLKKRVLDVLLLSNHHVESISENNIDITYLSDASNDWIFKQDPLQYSNQLHEPSKFKPAERNISHVNGYKEYVSYHAKKEIKGLNYANEKEEIEHLLKTVLNFENYEKAMLITLNNHGNVTNLYTISQGTTSEANIYPEHILDCVQSDPNNQYVVLFHNHPSGVAQPSPADLMLTERLNTLLELVDCRLVEHTIIAQNNGICQISDYLPDLQKNQEHFQGLYTDRQQALTL